MRDWLINVYELAMKWKKDVWEVDELGEHDEMFGMDELRDMSFK